QAEPEGGRGNAEDDVVAGDLALEVLLADVAAARVALGRVDPAGDDVQRVHAAVPRAIGLVTEPRLPDRSVELDERGHVVLRAERPGYLYLRVDLGAGAADRGLQVTPGAAVEIEAWAEAFGDDLLLDEVLLAGFEELHLVRRESGDRIARARRVVPPGPRVSGDKLSRCRARGEQNDHRDGKSKTSSHE